MYYCIATLIQGHPLCQIFMKIPQKHLQDLYHLFTKVKDQKIAAAILSDLLTPQELFSIAERLQIIKALIHGQTQRQIAKNLQISIGKVTRGSRVVQFGQINWKKFLDAS